MARLSFSQAQAAVCIGLCLSCPMQTKADLFDITVTATVSSVFGGPVFGETESTASVSFRLDTSAPIFIPAGTQWGPFPEDIIVTDLYGYQTDALSAVSAGYGTKTWDNKDVLASPFGGYDPNPSAAIWFDGPVTVGGNAIPTILFEDDDGRLVTGGMRCGLPEFQGRCGLTSIVEVFDSGTLGRGIGSPLTVTVSAVSARIEVPIDIRPAGERNIIIPKSPTPIRVAVLSTDVFDAKTVDPKSVRFGKTGTEAEARYHNTADIDRDGDPDLILVFITRDTAIECGDTSAFLIGENSNQEIFEGTDSITTAPCRRGRAGSVE